MLYAYVVIYKLKEMTKKQANLMNMYTGYYKRLRCWDDKENYQNNYQ